MMDTATKPPDLYVFDHSRALFGREAQQGVRRLQRLRDRLGVTGEPWFSSGVEHCLLKILRTQEHFNKWIGRIEVLPDFLINDVCRQAVDYGIAFDEMSAAIDFLKYRRQHFIQLLDNHENLF